MAQTDTYHKDGLNYLCSALFVPSFVIISETATTLLIPDDDSDLANNFRKNPLGPNDFLFYTPTSNLKFIPNFHKIGSRMINGLAIKDNSKITKHEKGAAERLQQITFKVIGENKVKKGEKNYDHDLTIEPLDLGIEGLPAITRINFGFHHPEPGHKRDPDMKGLEETWLYNHKILTESAGKSFSMKVNRFDISKAGSVQQLDHLYFNTVGKLLGNFDLDSFQQINTDNNNPPPVNNPPSGSGGNNGNSPTSSGNKFLIIGIVILIILLTVIGFFVVRRRKKM